MKYIIPSTWKSCCKRNSEFLQIPHKIKSKGMRSGAQIFFTSGRKGVFIAWTLDYYLKVGFYIFMNLVLVLVARLYMLSTFGLLHFARFTPLGQTHLYCWGVSYTNAHSETTFCTPYLRVLLKHKSDVQWVQASGQKSEFFPQIVTVLTFYTQSLLPARGGDSWEMLSSPTSQWFLKCTNNYTLKKQSAGLLWLTYNWRHHVVC